MSIVGSTRTYVGRRLFLSRPTPWKLIRELLVVEMQDILSETADHPQLQTNEPSTEFRSFINTSRTSSTFAILSQSFAADRFIRDCK